MLNKLFTYLRESKNEMAKVIWPSREETKNYTLMVVGVSLFVAAFMGILDYIFTKIVERIL